MEIDFEYGNFFSALIGSDEVGRGPIAGPVNACSVLISKKNYDVINKLAQLGITDSKKLSAHKRRKILNILSIDLDNIVPGKKYNVQNDLGRFSFVLSEKSAQQIDEINILQASLACMKESSDLLVTENCCLIIDGNKTFNSAAKKVEAVVKGDSKSVVIALASIIAKEFRDKKMLNYSNKYPGYGFEKNSGYPTKAHKEALLKLGITEIHRKTFKGVKELVD